VRAASASAVRSMRRAGSRFRGRYLGGWASARRSCRGAGGVSAGLGAGGRCSVVCDCGGLRLARVVAWPVVRGVVGPGRGVLADDGAVCDGLECCRAPGVPGGAWLPAAGRVAEVGARRRGSASTGRRCQLAYRREWPARTWERALSRRRGGCWLARVRRCAVVGPARRCCIRDGDAVRGDRDRSSGFLGRPTGCASVAETSGFSRSGTVAVVLRAVCRPRFGVRSGRSVVRR
jgi:hypothetical protein